jgi:predicted O-methyltransferase YrrM
VTGGGSSIPEVQRLLAVLAAGRRCAEAGTAFGEGAAALASTAASLVTVERDPERAAVARERLDGFANVELLEGDWQELLLPRGPFDLFFLDAGGIKQDPEQHLPHAFALLALGGTIILDDFTPGRTDDSAREAIAAHRQLVSVEILTTPQTAAILATRVAAAA